MSLREESDEETKELEVTVEQGASSSDSLGFSGAKSRLQELTEKASRGHNH